MTTVEYRGLLDVDRALARSDADGLYRLLVARGDRGRRRCHASVSFAGLVAPIENIEMVTAPAPARSCSTSSQATA